MVRRSLLLCLALSVAVPLLGSLPAGAKTTGARGTQGFDLDARIAAQRAVEGVYWRYREWPSQNPGAKPALDQVVSSQTIREKVERSLRLTNALWTYWHHRVTGQDLQAEIDREARSTLRPEMLRDLWAALDNDPVVIAETLARPILVERLARSFQAGDSRFRARSFDAWWSSVAPTQSLTIDDPASGYRLPDLGPALVGSWSPTHALPEADLLISAVWTGAEMIIWGGTEVGSSKFNSGSRYDPATDTWRTTSGVNAPPPRKQHTAVWTGAEMIVWGGCGIGDEHSCQINTGGRYDPVTDTWQSTATAGAPTARINHTAVWTGSVMVIWGGCRFSNDVCSASVLGNGGGRYDPASNSWQPTTTAGAPQARQDHTAVWSGTEMIVWGGAGTTVYANGSRYDPVADAWTPTAAVPPLLARYDHTAVWSGNQMIVWGGTNGSSYFDDGARYFPAQNRWRAVAGPARRVPAPRTPRCGPAPRWSCGAAAPDSYVQRRPTPEGGTTPPPTPGPAPAPTGAPTARSGHVAVWSGSQMIVWGSGRTGGRYDPATDTWTPTNADEAPSAREWHTATWTGAEMVVWGGEDRLTGTVNTGGRYDPATDSWRPTPTAGAPSARILHTAVWTGTRVIVWGGQNGRHPFRSGGRYDPVTNAWRPRRPPEPPRPAARTPQCGRAPR